MPTRLEFYENWLHATGMRDGRIGLAPLAAVLSFLRQEGEPYELVTARAGQYAAQWTFDNLSPFERSMIRSLPRRFARAWRCSSPSAWSAEAIWAAAPCRGFERGQGTITMRSSVFCSVRAPFPRPLCGYYAAALERSLTLVSVNGKVAVRSCQGTGASSCVIALSVLPEQG